MVLIEDILCENVINHFWNNYNNFTHKQSWDIRLGLKRTFSIGKCYFKVIEIFILPYSLKTELCHGINNGLKWCLDKDKRHECFFCGEHKKDIQEHITTVHRTEPEVSAILSLGEEEKRKKLVRLGNMGDHLHNLKVSEIIQL